MPWQIACLLAAVVLIVIGVIVESVPPKDGDCFIPPKDGDYFVIEV